MEYLSLSISRPRDTFGSNPQRALRQGLAGCRCLLSKLQPNCMQSNILPHKIISNCATNIQQVPLCISIDQGTNGGVEIPLFADQSPHRSRFHASCYIMLKSCFGISVHGQSCCSHCVRPWIMAYMSDMMLMRCAFILSQTPT